MRESSLPPEFMPLLGKVHYVRERIRGKEWSSSCPACGGTMHKHGEFPDRFRMWVKGKAGIPFGWCRACDYKWYPERDFKPDPAKIEAWRQERLAEERRIKEEAEQAIKLLTDVKKWEQYYSWLVADKIAGDYWRKAGITDEFWWNEWHLGYDPSHSFWFDTGEGWVEHVTPTATIAVRDITGRIVNIKHRLINPFEGVKYRMEYRTNTEPVFIANLDNKPEFTVICEGEKKAAVTWLTIDSTKVQAYGLPKNPSDDMLKAIKTKRVIDILDPDVKNKDIERKREVFSDTDYRIIRLPRKIDDMILEIGLGKEEIREIMKQARRF